MNRTQFTRCLAPLLSITCLSVCNAQTDSSDELHRSFQTQIQPLLATYCTDCHAGDDAEAEVDLTKFSTIEDLKRQTKIWQRVKEMLISEQMPPPDADQLPGDRKDVLQNWVHTFLLNEAEAHAGDPGPVTLRRLSNAEYTYTIRDLTGIESLDPAREFPVDGAAGEGFTNTGDALVMSPSLVQKYLAAAKDVASHAVLVPDGIRFSAFNTERDWTDERIAEIQEFYAGFCGGGGGKKIELQGLTFDTDQGGRLPLEAYLRATVMRRDDPQRDVIGEIGFREAGLNSKYFEKLWQALAREKSESYLMDRIRSRWRETKLETVDELAAEIYAWQDVLWQFNVVGHVGRDGTRSRWMEPKSPIQRSQAFRIELPNRISGDDSDVTLFLTSAVINTGDPSDLDAIVAWENARLEGGDRPAVPLRYVAGLQRRMDQLRDDVLTRTEWYLAAAAEAIPKSDIVELARKYELDELAMRVWLEYLQISEPTQVVVKGHFTKTIDSSAGYDFVKGWGSHETPSLLANSSDDTVNIPGTSPGRTIVAHPSPTLFTAAGWQSPIDGVVEVIGNIVDAHVGCGNGLEWVVQQRTGRSVADLWRGEHGAGGKATMPVKRVSVRKGDLISFVIGPRNGDHGCDLTQLNLVISEVEGEERVWDLAQDVTPDILAANPHPDRLGNKSVWHFYKGDVADAFEKKHPHDVVPAGSLLARWQAEQDPTQKSGLAKRIHRLVNSPPPEDAGSPDALLRQLMFRLVLDLDFEPMLDSVDSDPRFGRHPSGQAVDKKELLVVNSGVTKFDLPSELAAGRTLVVSANVLSKDAAVQFDVSLTEPQLKKLESNRPIVVAERGDSNSIEASFAAFRDLFPAALCYARIVPIDEVVTLTLFFREDDQLQRLMLNEQQTAKLNRMWDEFLYVSNEPLKYEVAFEQLREFSTQDRPDHVEGWKVHVDRTEKRIAAFRQRLLDTEYAHLQAVVDLAARAWRRPLTTAEDSRICETYQELRNNRLEHAQALRMTIARVLTSPAFLYRLEQPGAGSEAVAVSDMELANRLSYFLWSSMPDDALRRLADRGELGDERVLVEQTRRMLADEKTRRMAIHFACQWLHIRDFDKNDEKNEKLYPQFAELRRHMYAESVTFFEDLFRNDGSILDVINADYTFLDESLAKHYGIVGVAGSGVQKHTVRDGAGRGGILGMGTVLASLSGASRTSPILRGNWVSETLLGERSPKPPANVPQLPESVPSNLTARQLIEKHTSTPECAKCHRRIDPYGFALEQFDAIGRLRDYRVDTQTTLFDGTRIEGIQGLRDYLVNERRQDFVHQFCKKLLGYALGREVQLSDEPLLADMEAKLAAADYRFSVAVEKIVTSPQFRKIRGREYVGDSGP